MQLILADQIARIPDLSHQVRQLKVFDGHFRDSATAIGRVGGLGVDIDRTRLARGFLDWAEAFDRQRPLAVVDRRDFMIFAAGLMLASLLASDPARLIGGSKAPDAADDATAAGLMRFWPAGFLYTSYCLGVLDAVLAEDGQAAVRLRPEALELRVWASFRETVAETPSAAVGFFDFFVGAEPNWLEPATAARRPAIRKRVAA